MKSPHAAVLGMALSLAVASAAPQDAQAPKPAEGKTQTMTGCLNKGKDVAQHYSFTDQATGKTLTVTGPADLEKHSANHTVRLTGNMTAEVFKATKVEHVAATCDAKGGSATK